MAHAHDLPCHECAGERGWLATGLDFEPFWKACPNCGGTGTEPARAAGERYTGPKPQDNGAFVARGDLLVVLHDLRARHLEIERNPRATTLMRNLRRMDYEIVRTRAMRRPSQLALADVLARATMCAEAADRAVVALRSAA